MTASGQPNTPPHSRQQGRKAANVHSMVGGALGAALVGQAGWMRMVGLPRLLSCVDLDVFLNIVSNVALRTEHVCMRHAWPDRIS